MPSLPHVSKPSEEEELRREVNWFEVARLLLERAYICWQQRKPDGPKYVMLWVEDRAPAVLQELRRRLRIGPVPSQHVRRKLKDGSSIITWRWIIAKQLEVYWVLQNIRRFVRGAWAVRIDEALTHIEDTLSVHGRLKRFTFREAHEPGAIGPTKRPMIRRFPRRVAGG